MWLCFVSKLAPVRCAATSTCSFPAQYSSGGTQQNQVVVPPARQRRRRQPRDLSLSHSPTTCRERVCNELDIVTGKLSPFGLLFVGLSPHFADRTTSALVKIAFVGPVAHFCGEGLSGPRHGNCASPVPGPEAVCAVPRTTLQSPGGAVSSRRKTGEPMRRLESRRAVSSGPPLRERR